MEPATEAPIVRVAVPVPLHGAFDYRMPPGTDTPAPGARVLVPFGRRRLVAIVIETDVASDLPAERLRPFVRALDAAPVFDADLLALLRWAARYYHHPLGEVLATALPVALRRAGTASAANRHRGWQAVAVERDVATELARAPRQRELLDRIRANPNPTAHASLLAWLASAAGPLKALAGRGLIEAVTLPGGLERGSPTAAPALTDGQSSVVEALRAGGTGFAPALVEGVTGSGKTEVYFRRIAAALEAGRQVLFLAPEIGLTPQLIERVRARFDAAFGVLHSQRSDGERADVWRAAGAGDADIVIGTRSAVFTPMPRLGLIVVDEEHDGSYKQQDGFRYHARDVALKRAQLADVPVLLGSATPALETLHNARQRRFAHLQLPQRATGAAMPPIRVIDVRSRPLDGGLSEPLIARIEPHLAAGNQVMIFINRRGYAPAQCCHDCGWIAPCARCDAPLTLHGGGRRLQCHHCGALEPAPNVCPACGGGQLIALGAGTERVTGTLRSRFPDVAIARFDRDSMARRGRLEDQLADAARGDTQLLVGTQMLAKGHDFARLTCVGVLDVDGGLFSADFRAAEHMAQLVTQVAGRAGRAAHPGEVWLQTRHPEHPLLERLLTRGYAGFAEAALAERREAGLPPFGHLALLRAEATDADAPTAFLAAAAATIRTTAELACWGPVPAPMARRAGRHRAHLMLHAERRGALHPALDHWQEALPQLPEARRVRWSIDVDPQDLL
ncbi:primosomal protein N' [Salinisphaera orenii]|uniref:Replication restart protein PriA n=1 Tax=Salinisphaera orenii YIM 95161 TaxID=1051139 RepID=A0A423PN39_9GAMM|nr:primosomal protein N' [Salinisphaera halophila]ROO26998.1 primosome assembly protein PriA [Salinisphaera halophila YIM 95161]